ncbi:MAG: hypothetical protein Q9159_002263 [Coniocarpon cinnabarinum]
MTSKHTFLVILPDNPDAHQKRSDVRPQHIANIKPKAEQGWVQLGGAYLEDIPVEGAAPHPIGSMMIAYAESKASVMEELKQDIYATSGVWDMECVQIWPFNLAIIGKGLVNV